MINHLWLNVGVATDEIRKEKMYTDYFATIGKYRVGEYVEMKHIIMNKYYKIGYRQKDVMKILHLSHCTLSHYKRGRPKHPSHKVIKENMEFWVRNNYVPVSELYKSRGVPVRAQQGDVELTLIEDLKFLKNEIQ